MVPRSTLLITVVVVDAGVVATVMIGVIENVETTINPINPVVVVVVEKPKNR